jgi:autotransporter-associated beta strand protein
MFVQAFARHSRVALALVLLSAARPGTADTVWTNLTGTLRWNNPLNWSAGVPDATDLVRFPTLGTPAPIVLLDQDMQARALAVESDYLLFAGSLRLASGNIDVIGAGTETTLASELRGSAGLTKLGAGTLVLAGASTYSGVTRVAAGTLEIRSVSERLPDTSALTLDAGARLRLAGSSLVETVGTLRGAGTVLFDVGAHTLRIGADNGSGEFAGNLTDLGKDARLVKLGTGTQTLRGTNVLGNGLDLEAGRLALTAGETRTDVVFIANGAGLEVGPASLQVQSALTLAAGGSMTLGPAAEVTLGGSSNAGGTLESAGTLDVRGAGALLDLSAEDAARAKLGGAGGRLTITGGATTVADSARLRLAGGAGDDGGAGGVINLANGTLRLDNGTLELNGGAAGKGGAVGGAGLLDLTGGTFHFVAGRITDGRASVGAANAALLGARLRLGSEARMRLYSDFANLGGSLSIEGGTLDGDGAEGASGRRIDSSGLLTLSNFGSLSLRGGGGAAATDATVAGHGGDGGALALADGSVSVGAGVIDLGGGAGGVGHAAPGQLFAGGRGGDGGTFTLNAPARAAFDGGGLDLRGGSGGAADAAGKSGSATVTGAGRGGDGGQVQILGGVLDLLNGAALYLDGADGGRSPFDHVAPGGGDGGAGGRFELRGGTVKFDNIPLQQQPHTRLSLAGGNGTAPGGHGGAGGELWATGGSLTVGGFNADNPESEFDFSGGDGGRGFPRSNSVAVPDNGPGGKGGRGGLLTVDGAVVDLQQTLLDFRGGRGGRGGNSTHGDGDGGDGGRVRLLDGVLRLYRGELDLRGGEGGGNVLGAQAGRAGAAGAVGVLEQQGGTLALLAVHLQLSGLDVSTAGDGQDAGSILLLGGDTEFTGNPDGEDIIADGGAAASDVTLERQQGGRGGQGGRLVVDGAGTRHVRHSVMMSFDGGAGGVGSETGGAGGAGGELLVSDGDFRVGFDAAMSFNGGRGGRGLQRMSDTDSPHFGDGGAGGNFTVLGGEVFLGNTSPFGPGSLVRVRFEGGDAGNAPLDFRPSPAHVGQAGRGGLMRIVDGRVDVNSGALISMFGGRGGRVEGEQRAFSQGGTGGTLSIEGGETLIRSGAVLDLSGGAAITELRNDDVRGGRGGEVLVRASAGGRLVLDGGAVLLTGGRGTSAQRRDGPRGASGRVLVSSGELVLARGLVTGALTAQDLLPNVGGPIGADVGLVDAALEIEGGLVDVTSTLRMTHARLALSGGTLRAKHIVRGRSDFSFSGGTLDVGRFEGSLLNAGGVFEIGGDAGYSRVIGDYTQTKEGMLAIELLGAEASEALLIEQGRADLAGRLEIRLADDVAPLPGSDFDILVAELGMFGGFHAVYLPERAGLRFALVTRPDRLVLEVRAVPLPPAVALLGPALLVLWGRRRRA